MADSFAKKVIKNKPFKNAHGQYNFAGSINLGTDPVFDKVKRTFFNRKSTFCSVVAAT